MAARRTAYLSKVYPAKEPDTAAHAAITVDLYLLWPDGAELEALAALDDALVALRAQVASGAWPE